MNKMWSFSSNGSKILEEMQTKSGSIKRRQHNQMLTSRKKIITDSITNKISINKIKAQIVGRINRQIKRMSIGTKINQITIEDGSKKQIKRIGDGMRKETEMIRVIIKTVTMIGDRRRSIKIKIVKKMNTNQLPLLIIQMIALKSTQ